MNTTTAGILFTGSIVLALTLVYRPLGDYMYRVFTGTKHSRVERLVYRLIGANPDADQTWSVYARSALAFSVVSVLFLYVFQRVQNHLMLGLGFKPVMTHQAWNTAISFTTNTNWQSYSGESTMGHLVQMAGLAVQNFVSAAVGIAVAIALVRAIAARRSTAAGIGNFWVDLTRAVVFRLVPIPLLLAVVLVSQGVVQTLGHAVGFTGIGGQHGTIVVG